MREREGEGHESRVPLFSRARTPRSAGEGKCATGVRKSGFFFLFFLSSLLFLLRIPRTDVRRLCYETIYYHLVLAKVNNNNDGYTTRAKRRQVRSLTGFAAVRERRWRDLHPDGMESPRNQSLILVIGRGNVTHPKSECTMQVYDL